MEIEYVSAFTGIGGFEVGFDRVRNPDGSAFFKPTAFIEINPSSQAVLRHHWPHVPLKGDISGVTAVGLGRPRLAVAGFPCTNTSIGHPERLGLDGSESQFYWDFWRLLSEYLRLVDATRPQFVVIENPVGLLTSPGLAKPPPRGDGVDRTGWDMAAITRSLVDIGYVGAWRVLDGRDFGSPQRRERVILVACLGGDPRLAWQVLGLTGAGEEAVGARPLRAVPQGRPDARAVSPVTDGGLKIWRKSARPTKSLAAGGFETWPEAEFANSLSGFDYGLATRQTHLVRHPDGRMRTLTLREWERLQDFPDDWTDVGISDSARGIALGAAMHAGMASWLGQGLADVARSVTMHPAA
jgi:DNA (cytosine-5)-methyltransferase 1